MMTRWLIILALIFPNLVFAAEWSSAESLARQLGQFKHCGPYQAKNGFFDELLFIGGNQVQTTVFGQQALRPFLVHHGGLFIITETEIVAFKIGKKDLIGIDRWTQGQKYRLKKKPGQECLAFSSHEDALKKIENLVCYVKIFEQEKAWGVKKAGEAYLKCCQSGSAMACDRYGVIQRRLKKDKIAHKYFTKSCEMDYGVACKNLGNLEKEQGNLEAASKAYLKACENREMSVCLTQ